VCAHLAESRVVAECIRSDRGKSFHLLRCLSKIKATKCLLLLLSFLDLECCPVRLWIMDVTGFEGLMAIYGLISPKP